MAKYKYWVVDSFSKENYLGNPASIVFGGEDLATEKMQTIARHFNLSETVFLCKPSTSDADYKARIFTPAKEVPFAGHPTIASAFSYYNTLDPAAAKDTALVRQECGAGIIPLEIKEVGGAPLFTMTLGKYTSYDAKVDKALAAKMVGCPETDFSDNPIEVISPGLPWMIIQINSLDALKTAKPDQGLIEEICDDRKATGITAYARGAELDGVSYHIRSWAPSVGIKEDPVCGSGNGAVLYHLASHDLANKSEFSYRAEQGLEIHRGGILYMSVSGNGTENAVFKMGGHASRVMEGILEI